MKVPRSIINTQVEKEILIPNPGIVGKEKREYISREYVNGFRRQTFTSYDYPENIPGYFIHLEEDPGNGEIHPAYLTICTEKGLTLCGRDGWFAGTKEMDLIPRTLLSQSGIASIRSIRENDINYKRKLQGKFWFPSPTFANGAKTEFLMRYMEDGKIRVANLYRSDGHEESTTCSILAVVVLDINVRLEENITNKSRWLWE